jgi:hypothetical protein
MGAYISTLEDNASASEQFPPLPALFCRFLLRSIFVPALVLCYTFLQYKAKPGSSMRAETESSRGCEAAISAELAQTSAEPGKLLSFKC